MTTSFDPTTEQTDILDAYLEGGDLTIIAGAGTGKTSTLQLLADATEKKRRVLYLAFNKAVQTEAENRFPTHVECRTAHSLAFRAVGKDYKHRLNAGRVPFQVTKRILGIGYDYPQGVTINGKFLPLSMLQRLALDTVRNFCRTTKEQPGSGNVPTVEGIDEIGVRGQGHDFLATILVPAAQKAWVDITDADGGQLYFTHDHYLKIWADTKPTLPFDVIFFDEAQDADPLIRDVIQRQNHAQRVVVGDSNQAIYGWRGAIDALDHFEGKRLPLSESFRFGPEIAAEANRFLDLLGAELRIVGRGAPGAVEPLAEPDAVLCRTNGGTITELFTYLDAGLDCHLVGGASDIEGFCDSALKLKRGERPYGQFAAFATWNELEDYVRDDPSGSDLAVLVRLVNEHGAQAIIDALTRCVPESRADVVITTAHKAKGREWKRVRIHVDFERKPNKETGELDPPSPEYLKLAYVAVTRAKKILDPGPLLSVEIGNADLSTLDDVEGDI